MTDTDLVAERPVPTLPATAPLQTPVLRRLGHSDLRVYPLAIGGNVFGWTADATATDAVLDRYTELGGNFIDTADSYAGGRSEIMIGNWLRRRRRRDDLVIATKIGKSADHPGLSSQTVVDAVTASLRRLRTDRIDLLYLHVDDEQVPFEETLMAVDQLIRTGLVRYFGGSHHTGNRLIQARVACAMLGVAPMVALQNHYNLMHRTEYETGLAHIARAQELGVMPRFALASGFLSGKYRTRADLDGSARAAGIAPHMTKRGFRVLAALDRIAAAHDVSCATIALAWLLAKPLVVAPVTSATEPEQVDELMAAAQLRLTRQQVVELDRASA